MDPISAALAIGSTVASIAGGVSKGNAERDAAEKANKAEIKKAKEQHELNLKLWEIDVLQGKASYAAQVAEVSAMRYQNAVKKADYESNQNRVIDAALQNLRINAEQLNQTYVLEEAYRARQVSQSLLNDLGVQSINAQESIDSLTSQSAITRNNANTANIESMQSAAATLNNAQADILDLTTKSDQNTINAQAEALTLQTQFGQNTLTAQSDILALQEQSAQTRNKANESNINSMQAAVEYLNSIKTRGLQADQLLASKEQEGQDIQELIVIAESMDTIRRDASYLAAIAEDAGLSAKTTARQGGSSSAKRQGLQAMQALGRTYGEMMLTQKEKRRKLSNYNSELVGKTASDLAIIAQQMKGEADKIQHTSSNNAIRQKGYELMQLGFASNTAMKQKGYELMQGSLGKSAGIKQKGYELSQGNLGSSLAINKGAYGIKQSKISRDNEAKQTGYSLTQSALAKQMQAGGSKFLLGTRNSLKNFTELTIPSFALARASGNSQAEALIRNTINRIDAAGTPYRDDIIFDPLEPIAGLKPVYSKPTERAVPGSGAIWGNALMDGAKTFMAGAGTDNSGNFTWG